MALIRLRVCAGWSEAFLVAHTTLLETRMRRLIWGFAGRTYHIVGNTYAQADLRLCWLHIPHCWKHVCAGWSEALLVAHTTLLEISSRGSYCLCSLTMWDLSPLFYGRLRSLDIAITQVYHTTPKSHTRIQEDNLAWYFAQSCVSNFFLNSWYCLPCLTCEPCHLRYLTLVDFTHWLLGVSFNTPLHIQEDNLAGFLSYEVFSIFTSLCLTR